jgi:flagellar L-ring protein precursor FlgH
MIMNKDHPMSRPIGCLISMLGSLLLSCCGGGAFAQNLVMPGPSPASVPAAPGQNPADAPPTPPSRPTSAQPEAAQPAAIAPGYAGGVSVSEQLQGVSLFVVSAPPPKKYAKHDVIEVIINESSAESFTQTTDYKKDYTLKAELSKFPSLSALFEDLALREGIGSIKPAVGVTGNKQTKGTGKFDRKDQVTAKISAFVIDVKPNGNLTVEARESRSSDKEVTTMVLSGTCRAEDITKNNTIQSAQLADLTIRIEHEGNVKESGEKGFIPRILEAVFNF